MNVDRRFIGRCHRCNSPILEDFIGLSQDAIPMYKTTCLCAESMIYLDRRKGRSSNHYTEFFTMEEFAI